VIIVNDVFSMSITTTLQNHQFIFYSQYKKAQKEGRNRKGEEKEEGREEERSELKERSLYEVRQDNVAPTRYRAASDQPYRRGGETRARRLTANSDRSPKTPKRSHSTKRQTVPATAWVTPALRDEIDRIAAHNGAHRSETMERLLEWAVHQSIHEQHEVMVKPIVERAIAEQSRRDRMQFAQLLIRIAYDANQTRSLVTNVLGRQEGVTPDVLNKIRDWSSHKARQSILAKSPQIEELLTALHAWLDTEVEEPKQR
jgi:hypothetical protein